MVKNEQGGKQKSPNFVSLYQRYAALDNGLKAALRRVGRPDDLRDTVALYRLFYESRSQDNWLQVVFLIPWCTQCKTGTGENIPTFGASLALNKVNEKRVLQIARSTEPLGIILLRRLAIQVKPAVDWEKFGWTLLKWGRDEKRQIVEDFFYKTTFGMKGA